MTHEFCPCAAAAGSGEWLLMWRCSNKHRLVFRERLILLFFTFHHVHQQLQKLGEKAAIVSDPQTKLLHQSPESRTTAGLVTHLESSDDSFSLSPMCPQSEERLIDFTYQRLYHWEQHTWWVFVCGSKCQREKILKKTEISEQILTLWWQQPQTSQSQITSNTPSVYVQDT